MNNKQLLYSREARQKIKAGVDKIADAVKVTMGARGRLVVIDQGPGSPRATKDGVTVAKSIQVKDRFENMGVELVKEASGRTNDLVGDGTTATALLAQVIYREAEKLITSGENPIEIRNGIEEAVKATVEALRDISKKVETKEELIRVATISATDEEIGKLVAEVLWEIGADGIVAVEESETTKLYSERVRGLQIDSGYLSPYMVTNPERGFCELEDVKVLVVDKKINLVTDLKPLMEEMVAAGNRNLVIFAENVEGPALQFLVLNRVQGRFNALAVRAPGFGERRREILEDICSVTGATLIAEELGRKAEDARMADCGSAKRAVAMRDRALLIDGGAAAEKVDARVKLIEQQIESAEDEFDKNRHRDRKARVLGGVGVFRVGASTESELREKKQRVEDAIFACKGALKEGIVPGGGMALLAVRQKLADRFSGGSSSHPGSHVISKALEAPLKQIVENAGHNGEHVLAECLRLGQGFNVATGKHADMLAEGVIDPTSVVRLALEHGASVANLLISTECIIVDEIEEKK